ncbi:hypothetical protein PV326_008008 [Microctonus aethiopoides]|nr:hypothetical protein PV326_008008 [Microctonus aethiopoides]
MALSGGMSTFVELLRHIQLKKTVVNIKNNDEYCFLWSVISAHNQTNINVNITSSYPHYTEANLKYEKRTLPMTLDQIPKFESRINNSLTDENDDDISSPFWVYLVTTKS